MEPLTAGVGVPCQPRGGCHEDRVEDKSLSREAQAGVSPRLKVARACPLALLCWRRQWPPLCMGPATRPRTWGPRVEPCGPGPRSPAFHRPLHLALRTARGTQPAPDSAERSACGYGQSPARETARLTVLPPAGLRSGSPACHLHVCSTPVGARELSTHQTELCLPDALRLLPRRLQSQGRV